MDTYITYGDPKPIYQNGINCIVQYYQRDHKNKFLIRSPTGEVLLYENHDLKQQWEENEKGKRSFEYVAYKNGRVDFQQRFEDITEQKDYNKKE